MPYLDREQIISYLKESNKSRAEKLLKLADSIREETVKSQVCIHGIIEFSNYCRSSCVYCGIRAESENLTRYRMPLEEIKKTAINAAKNLGYKMLVLQSGEDLWYDADKLYWLIKEIKKEVNSLMFLSIGERDYETYEKLYKAGARGSLFRFETSDKQLYEILHPDSSFENRIEHINFMREIGYLVASGPIIGLPGQTIESLANDIYLMKDLNIAMASMGPFIPSPDTPLGYAELRGLDADQREQKNGQRKSALSQRKSVKVKSIDLTLKMIALTRIVCPKVRIPITTALEKIGGQKVRIKTLNSGANAFMLNLTPAKYRENYKIYPGKNKMKMHLHEAAAEELKNLIKASGRSICLGWGKNYALTKEKFISGCKVLLRS